MVNIIIKGGLGNQMFQYALFSYLKSKGIKAKLNISLYNTIEMHNGFELNRIFPLHMAKKEITKGFCQSIILRFILKFKLERFVYMEKGTFIPNIDQIHKHYLDGYWQNSKYFKEIEKDIRKEYTFLHIDKRNMELTSSIETTNSVSLHIRRGDYVGTSSDISADNYYSEAINLMTKKVESPFFYIFSNDLSYTNSFINQYQIKYKIIDFNNGKNSYKDMYLMSKCKHHIIANSSFSWWGAWLGKQKEENITIAPNKFTNSETIPSNWIKL